MYTKNEIEQKLTDIKQKYGEWTYDIPLPFGIWTRGNLKRPHMRLKRIVQIASDLSSKPLSECRVLDLGCLDGIFSVEFAQQGANTVGVEIREANIQKAIFCKDVLGLHNLEFCKDDVRNVSVDTYGKFDVIICSGILYHLSAEDVVRLIQKMYAMTQIVIIDTHISLRPTELFSYEGNQYRGHFFQEHEAIATDEQKEAKLWASIDNTTSFWFTRPSLVNILSKAGFSSVYECFIPALIQHLDRCTFVAFKGTEVELNSSPHANGFQEPWPETHLQYVSEFPREPLYKKTVQLLKKILGVSEKKLN